MSRKVVKASGLESRAAWTGGRRWGREERHFLHYRRARARLWASAGQAPESRTVPFQAGLERGGEVRVRTGSGREYFRASSLTWLNQECLMWWFSI